MNIVLDRDKNPKYYYSTKSYNSMKKNVLSLFFFAFISIATAIFSISEANAQTNCDVIRYHGQGYSTRIFSVINNWNGTYTIVLIVENDGCPGPGCKKMNHYAVEADPGTYSNISVQALSGSFTFANIDYGPTIGGIPFQGFRISNANGMETARPPLSRSLIP